MGYRVVRVSSRALGPRRYVRVVIYDTLAEMQAAGQAYNGNDQTGVAGLTQSWGDAQGRSFGIIVRLARGRLGSQVVSHELHHAATAIYGSTLGDRISRQAHLNHYNEPFAHLYSDLFSRLVDRLYELGYYGGNDG